MIERNGQTVPVRSVGEFTRGMSDWFASRRWLQNIAISGEVSEVNEGNIGQLHFKLKEGQSVLACVAWSNKRRELPEFKDGMAVIAFGSVAVYGPRSGYTLHVEALEPTGLGNLFLLYERLKTKFRSEGLFEAARKRSVPELPRRVALVSALGKAVADFRDTIARSVPFVEVTFVETRVQGQGAEIDIAQALDRASKLDVDAIVLARGGGTYEDLFPFNLEPVIRAIVRAKVPVITAIAHTEDRHLADDVADRSFGTPSLAAEAIARGWSIATNRLRNELRDLHRAARGVVLRSAMHADSIAQRLERVARQDLVNRGARLRAVCSSLERRNPQRTLAQFRQRLAGGGERLNGAVARVIARKAQQSATARERLERSGTAMQRSFERRLERALATLDRRDPLAPLAHGYAIVSSGGRAVRDAATLRAGDAIVARLERGMVSARVESVSNDVRHG